jgi:hypothetical protein
MFTYELWYVLVTGEVRVTKRDHLEHSGLDRRIIMNWIFEKWGGGIDWIDMDQDRKGKREYVNAVINRRIP